MYRKVSHRCNDPIGFTHWLIIITAPTNAQIFIFCNMLLYIRCDILQPAIKIVIFQCFKIALFIILGGITHFKRPFTFRYYIIKKTACESMKSGTGDICLRRQSDKTAFITAFNIALWTDFNIHKSIKIFKL